MKLGGCVAARFWDVMLYFMEAKKYFKPNEPLNSSCQS